MNTQTRSTLAARTAEENQARAQAMWDRYQAGLTVAQIGQEYGITKQAVSHCLRKYGFCIRSKRLCPLDLESLYARYQAGEKLTALAADTGISENYLRKRLKLAGYALCPKWSREMVETMYRCYVDEHLTQQQVGDRFHTDQTWVSYLFKKYRFPARNDGRKHQSVPEFSPIGESTSERNPDELV